LQSNSYDSAELSDDERKRARLAAALLGFVAMIQLLGMLGHGVRQLLSTHGLGAAWPHLAIALPAGAFALGWWRGRRLRFATIAFALLWAIVSVSAAVQMTRWVAQMAAGEPRPATTPISPWFLRLVAARSIFFLAAAIVVVTGSAGKTRRMAGAALSLAFALLFVAEHLYPNVP
jgi:hypothetical protein